MFNFSLANQKTKRWFFPLAMGGGSLLFVAINERVSWPILRFFNVWASDGFIDLNIVLRYGQCYESFGVSVYGSTPPEGCRNFWYGEYLLRLISWMNLNTSHTFALAMFLIAVKFSILGFIFFTLSPQAKSAPMKLIFACIIFSPPMLLLIQRGNVDLLMNILIFSSWLLIIKKKIVPAWILLGCASLFKYYAIPGLFVVSIFAKTLPRKLFLFLISALVALEVWKNIDRVEAFSLSPSTMDQLFGFRFMSTWLDATSTYSISGFVGWFVDIAMLVGVIVTLYFFTRNNRIFLPDGESRQASWVLTAIILGILLLGESVDYRLVLVGFSSLLILDTRNKESPMSSWNLTSVSISAIFILCFWLTYPSGKLQILGDLAVVFLVCIICVIEIGKRQTRKQFVA